MDHAPVEGQERSSPESLANILPVPDARATYYFEDLIKTALNFVKAPGSWWDGEHAVRELPLRNISEATHDLLHSQEGEEQH